MSAQDSSSTSAPTGIAWVIAVICSVTVVCLTVIVVTGHTPDAIIAWASTLLPLLVVQLVTNNKVQNVASLVNGNLSARLQALGADVKSHVSETVAPVVAPTSAPSPAVPAATTAATD